MKHIKDFEKKSRPVRVLQFGSGGFLRGFADWMLQKLNDAELFHGSVAVVQSTDLGRGDELAKQNCLYTHIVRGTEGAQTTVVDVIDHCVKPKVDFEGYLQHGENPDLRFVISNTTEAGIVFDSTDQMTDTPPKSFPGKLTLLLKRRFDAGFGGLVFLPCELIERNGDTLRDTILQYSKLWNLGEDFEQWIVQKNVFCNTLVDRINAGYPKGENIDLGYEDALLNTSEYYHLWVIETDYDLEKELPFSKAGLNVIVTKDGLERYRTRKVRMLNGAHTSMVAHALLSGVETVKECMDNEKLRAFLHTCLYEEIIPTLDLPEEELKEYAQAVLTRFANPYIKHYWSAISLNSVSKYKVRVLPSVLEYKKRFGKYPKNLIFSLARLLEFYRVGTPNDAPEVIDFIRSHTDAEILANTEFWGQDLTELKEVLANAYSSQ